MQVGVDGAWYCLGVETGFWLVRCVVYLVILAVSRCLHPPTTIKSACSHVVDAAWSKGLCSNLSQRVTFDGDVIETLRMLSGLHSMAWQEAACGCKRKEECVQLAAFIGCVVVGLTLYAR